MRKIGFVDFYISEWHANNYPAWIAQANEKLGTDFEVAYAWAEQDVSPIDQVTTAQWCESMGVQKCDTLAELCEKSDVILVLAPSNPEKHLQYAKEVLAYKKPTYIDKTFAPDCETAQKIFDIANEYGCPFFTTSALRYADELAKYRDAQHIILTGGGGNFAEYLIHTVEMAVVLLNSPAVKVKTECVGDQRICRIQAQSGNEAVIVYSPCLEFSITAQLADGTYEKTPVTSDFFVNLIAGILKFFDNVEAPFDPAQTMEVMRVRTALIKAESQDQKWMDL